MLLASVVVALIAACHMGLPPEPPGADPSDPNNSAAPYQRQANPYETSAFAGEPAPAADPHAGHGTMNHGPATAPTGDKQKLEPPQEMKMPSESPR